jgi:hypothetical protein
VDSAMEVIESLGNATKNIDDYLAAKTFFDTLNVRLFLRFHAVSWGKRIVHKPLGGVIVGQHNERHSANDFVPLTARTLQRFIHPSIESRLKWAMINAKVIEHDGALNYVKGVKSRGYRLSGNHQGDLRRVECTSRSMAAKILAHRMTKLTIPFSLQEEAEVYRFLFHWQQKLEIDLPAATGMIMSSSKIKSPGHNVMTCETIAHKEWEFHICAQGRVHTNATRLLSEARDYLRIDGQPLVNIDIRNSQLVFLAMLFMGHRYRSFGTEGHEIDPDFFDGEEQDFLELVMAGQLYDHMMEASRTTLTRKEFKQKFFCHVIYGNSNQWFIDQTPLAQMFKSMFPSIYSFILAEKQDRLGDVQGEGFKRLPCQMQKRESQFMINTVCNRLMLHHPVVPIITIHDSILTVPQHEPLVRRIILEEFNSLGVRPTLSQS